jgi:hypothetical protein
MKITTMISRSLPITITIVLHLLLSSNNHDVIVRLCLMCLQHRALNLRVLAQVLPIRPMLNLTIPVLICLMTYPESLPKIRGNKKKCLPGIKAKDVLNYHLMNLSRFPFHLHTSLKGKQKYQIDLAMCMVINIPLKFYGTMTSSLSFLTRNSKFVTKFCGKSPNIEMSEHRRFLMIY